MEKNNFFSGDESKKPSIEVPEVPKVSIESAVETIGNSLEISPTLNDNVALCVIKPDAFKNRENIIKMLKGCGLHIVKRTPAQLSEGFVVNEMYGGDKLPKPLAEATARHFLSGPSEVVIVQGDNVIAKLLNLVGLKTNPKLCDKETIRYIYGDHVPEKLAGGLEYYRNAAHRPTSPDEAQKDLKKFKDLI
jgi:nucleoside diphosphate kinase